ERRDQNIFKTMHILVHVEPPRPQVNDRVANELARTVVGHFATTIYLEHGHATLQAIIFAEQHVLPLTAPPNRVRVRMFQKNQYIVNEAALARQNQPLLQLPRCAILHPSRTQQQQRPAVRHHRTLHQPLSYAARWRWLRSVALAARSPARSPNAVRT